MFSLKDMKRLVTLKSGFLLLLTLMSLLGAKSSFAFNTTILCTDIGLDTESCSLQSTGNASSTAMLDLIGDLVNAINDTEETDSSCDRVGDNVTCSLVETDLELSCTVVDGEVRTGDCALSGSGGREGQNLQSLLSLTCETSGTTGECTIGNDAEEVVAFLTEAVGDVVTGNDFRYLSNMAIGCGTLTGTDSFQRDCNNLLSVLANGDADQVASLIDTISPKNIDAAADVNVFKSQQLTGTVKQRLMRVRSGSTGVDTAALYYFDGHQWLRAGDQVASNEPATMNDAGPNSTPSIFESEKFGVFVDGSLVTTEFDDSENERSAETDDQQLTMGVDYRFTSNFVGGVAFSMSTSSTDFGNNRGNLDTTNFTLIGYGSYYKDAWYVDASISLGGDRYDQERILSCSASECGVALDNTLESDYYGDQTSFTVGGGYDFSFGEWAMTPFVQYASTTVGIDDYKENAKDPDAVGAGYALDIDDQDRDSSIFTIGTDLRYTLNQDWGVLVPYVGLEFINEMDDDAVFVSGRFLGNVASDDKFELATGEIDSSYAYLSIGTSAIFAGGGAAFIDLKSLQSYADVDQLRITGGYRMAF